MVIMKQKLFMFLATISYQILIPKSNMPIPTARYMVCLYAYSDAVFQPKTVVPLQIE